MTKIRKKSVAKFNEETQEFETFTISEWIEKVDGKVEDFFDGVYEYIPGRYFGLIGLSIYMLSTLVAVILYILSGADYSILTHWISHLGDGPGGAKYVFNIGFFLSGIVLFFFHVYEIRKLRKKGIKERFLDIMSIVTILLSIGLVLVAAFPLHLGLLHLIAAVFYFAGGFGFSFLYGILVLRVSKAPNINAAMAFITSFCYVLYFMSPLIVPHTLKAGITMFFLEWLTLFAEFSMLTVIVGESFFERKQKKKCMIIVKAGVKPVRSCHTCKSFWDPKDKCYKSHISLPEKGCKAHKFIKNPTILLKENN